MANNNTPEVKAPEAEVKATPGAKAPEMTPEMAEFIKQQITEGMAEAEAKAKEEHEAAVIAKEAEIESKAKKAAQDLEKHLGKSKKEKVTIREDQLNKHIKTAVVVLNGIKLEYNREEEIEVPVEVYEILKNAKLI